MITQIHTNIEYEYEIRIDDEFNQGEIAYNDID